MAALLQLSHGTVFAGDFRVVRPLSEGGMGAVYVVEQLSTGKQRALKVMHPNLVHDPKQRQRFVQEAKIGANIESDHVVEVLGAGVENESPWLVMELLQGETLDARIETKGPLSAKDVALVYGQLCHAVAAAHDVGIVHRDLKPENVFLAVPRREGVPFTVKVLDFGIAKLVAESGNTTQAIGSPLWMAPEQTNAEAPISPATDVWALGLIAFASLTGKSYWKGAHVETPNPMTIVMEVCFEPIVAASERAAELGVAALLPAGFDGWFAQCVDRDPNRRFANVRALRAALDRVLVGEPPKSAGVPDLDLGPVSRPKPVEAPTSPASSSLAGPELDLPKPAPKPPAPKPDARPTAPRPTPEAAPKSKKPEILSPAEMLMHPPPSRPHKASRPSVGIVRPDRAPERAFPTAKVVFFALVVLGGLFVAQRFFWTRKAPDATPPPPIEKPTASAKTSASGSVFAPCPAGMARIPGGELVAGDPTKIVDSYCLDVSEVTVKAYSACVKSGKCTPAATTGNWVAASAEEKAQRNQACNGHRGDRQDHPINCVDATQADAYCAAQSKRLPTESEWEWAARSGAARFKYPWGVEAPDVQLCWSAIAKKSGTCPVAAHPKGDDTWGVHDLAGNVREWTSTGVGGERVHCGSDWTEKLPDELFKLGYCGQAPKPSKSAFLGFRCAQ